MCPDPPERIVRLRRPTSLRQARKRTTKPSKGRDVDRFSYFSLWPSRVQVHEIVPLENPNWRRWQRAISVAFPSCQLGKPSGRWRSLVAAGGACLNAPTMGPAGSSACTLSRPARTGSPVSSVACRGGCRSRPTVVVLKPRQAPAPPLRAIVLPARIGVAGG